MNNAAKCEYINTARWHVQAARRTLESIDRHLLHAFEHNTTSKCDQQVYEAAIETANELCEMGKLELDPIKGSLQPLLDDIRKPDETAIKLENTLLAIEEYLDRGVRTTLEETLECYAPDIYAEYIRQRKERSDA